MTRFRAKKKNIYIDQGRGQIYIFTRVGAKYIFCPDVGAKYIFGPDVGAKNIY